MPAIHVQLQQVIVVQGARLHLSRKDEKMPIARYVKEGGKVGQEVNVSLSSLCKHQKSTPYSIKEEHLA